ncbi:alpha/beta hydrolase family protein [Microbacterium amylolyticum]|uniref:Dipeptidyl aminopeptidase/acylaminoacyl peptidase n=1 Tax=Microbacterium amylolyticum TaxID=936337 RepID=A0ABS4ZFS8_9MICO|nr:prolyl oligopeptidase family serine peptidase [Microbacterium amylolyticum]MBP2436139.1 dipeptidyl aminopeptidase/acylaminoacyl peptidase [Microbacterium amylolyticum]
MARTLPYGTWPSPISAASMPEGSLRLGRAQYVADSVWWAESVPQEQGRTAIMRGDGEHVLSAPWSARSRVHEYGGGPWVSLDDERFAFVNQKDQRVYLAAGMTEPLAMTADDARESYGDLVWAEGSLWAVRETHSSAHTTPRRDIVTIPLDGSHRVVSVVSGSDFLAYPAPRAGRLAWIAWNHPDMPWDAAELRVGTLAGGVVTEWVTVAGGHGAASDNSVSALQPEWTGDDELMFLQDPPLLLPTPTGDHPARWNLFWARFDEGIAPLSLEAIYQADTDTGGPLWQLGARWYAPLDDGRVLAVSTNGRSALVLIDPTSGAVSELETPLTGDVHIHDVRGARVLLTGGGSSVTGGLWELDLDGHSLEALRGGTPATGELWSIATPLTFPGPRGDVHAFFYPPHNPDFTAPEGELPPVIVLVHGGPTGHVTGDLSQSTAFWTSRGIGVLDVNYGGSSGYGRAYRERLRHTWGIADVHDVAAAAQGLVDGGLADPKRLAIKGGSAGGWTVLCALADTDVFSAGISRYGVADLRLLLAETHDFEARYIDSLVGPWPESEDEYVRRSPLSRPESLRTPLLILQGSEDPVVPPSQSEALRDVMSANGVPHAYLLFDGESHGFRGAETITACFEAELSFLGQVLGFETPGVPTLDLH